MWLNFLALQAQGQVGEWQLSSVLFAEMDEEDCERRRSECVDEMMYLEKEFSEVKEK